MIIIMEKVMLMKKNKCVKCDHEWIQRTEKKSVECPDCKSRKWNKKGGKNEKR